MNREEHFQRVLRAAQAGAEWAVAELYRANQPRLLRYLRAHVPDEADDLASDVWLDAATGLRRFEGDEVDLRRWLFTIARRRVTDRARREARRRTAVVAADTLADLPVGVDTETEALDAISTEAALRQIAALPRDQAEVVLLRVVAGLPTEDVAAVMGKRAGTIRVLQHRALAQLSKHATRLLVTL